MKLFTKQSTWEKFKDLIKSVRKSNRSSKAKDYYQRFLKEVVNTKIEEKKQPTKAVVYSKTYNIDKSIAKDYSYETLIKHKSLKNISAAASQKLFELTKTKE